MLLNYQIYRLLGTAMNSTSPVGAGEVMEQFGISKSAAYLLIEDCLGWLEENVKSVRLSVENKMIYFKTSEERLSVSKRIGQIRPKDYHFSAEERLLYSLILLVRSPKVPIEGMTEVFQISRNTGRADQKRMEKLLSEFGLVLQKQKSGFHIAGKEYDSYRLCLWLSSYLLNCLYTEQTAILFSLYSLKEEHVEEICRKLSKLMKGYSLEYNREGGYLFAISFLLITERIKYNGAIKPDEIPNYDQTVGYHEKLFLVLKHAKLLESYVSPDLYRRDFYAQGMRECFGRILFYTGVETGSDVAPIRVAQDDLSFYAHHIIKKYESYAGLRFEDANALNQSIVISLKTVILRRKYQFKVCNALASEIKKYYSHILEITKNALEGTPYFEHVITEEDAIPFAVNFLGWMYKGKPITSQTLHILIVCSANIGTSLLLKGQIASLYPGAVIHTAVIGSDYSNYAEYIDFIVSTVPLVTNDIPLVVVNTFLTAHDKYQLERMGGNKQGEDANYQRFVKDFIFMAKDFMPSYDIKVLLQRLNSYFMTNKGKIIYETGGKPMLGDLITKERIQLVDQVDGWEAAIRLASKPLEEDASVEPSYTEAMIDSVKRLGPYIVLAPGIALPHARPESGVRAMSMALLKVSEPVYFTEEKYANLFFVLASTDGTSHLDALRELSIIFSDHSAMEKFMNSQTRDELYELIR